MITSLHPNSVTLSEDGYVMVKLVGKQDYLSMEQVGRACKALADQLRVEHKQVRGLIDFTEDTSFNTGTNKAALKALEEINYDKAAMFGKNKLLIEVTKAMIAALGKSESTKVFDTREEAEVWLRMRDPLRD